MIKIEDSGFDILLDKKSYKNILIYDVSYNTLMRAKPLHTAFNKVDGFIGDYDGTKYLVLFHLEKYNPILDRIRCVIWLENGTACWFSELCKNRIWFRWWFASRKNIDYA